ncbi:MAG: competence/damage-inducible protein A [Clostridia bacterium]|nr:competence/damage-inducible protein A [Clostridia bacterium]
MIAEILCIGTELLLGQIVNTDACYLSRELAALGIGVYHHTTVGDNPARLREALATALARADVVITTGGLGPTADDLSKEIVAEHFSLPMEEDAPSLEAMSRFFTALGREMTPNNRKQARFAQGAIVLPNERGTAPGCIVEQGGKCVIQLPGPPRELERMFERSAIPYLREKVAGSITSRYVRIFGVGESEVDTRLRDLIDAQGEVTIASYCSLGEVQLRLTARADTPEAARAAIAPVEAVLLQRLGGAVYAVCDAAEDSLAHHAVAALLEAGKTVAVAESCTGGLVTASLVEVPGVSAALMEGQVTYSNAAKVRRLGVSKRTLEAHGAVSEQTAREMAAGLRARAGVDIAVATTGIAGPEGGSPEKPVGLVYVAVATARGERVRELRLTGDRNRIRWLATLHALNAIRLAAKDNET